MSNLAQVTALIMVPVVITVIAAALSSRMVLGPKLMSGVQHFAAGVVLAAVAGEVLPALREEGHIWWSTGGFILGTVLIIVLEFVGERESKAEESKTRQSTAEKGAVGDAAAGTFSPAGSSPAGSSQAHASAHSTSAKSVAIAALPLGMLIPVGVDLLMDGMLVGLGASLGFTQALILTIALTIEVLFLGISLSASLRQAGQSSRNAVLWTAGVAAMMLIGALGGVLVLGGASPQVLAAALAFGAAALLYLAVEELMIEAHENAETPWLTSLFFVGFIVIYVLGAVAE